MLKLQSLAVFIVRSLLDDEFCNKEEVLKFQHELYGYLMKIEVNGLKRGITEFNQQGSKKRKLFKAIAPDDVFKICIGFLENRKAFELIENGKKNELLWKGAAARKEEQMTSIDKWLSIAEKISSSFSLEECYSFLQGLSLSDTTVLSIRPVSNLTLTAIDKISIVSNIPVVNMTLTKVETISIAPTAPLKSIHHIPFDHTQVRTTMNSDCYLNDSNGLFDLKEPSIEVEDTAEDSPRKSSVSVLDESKRFVSVANESSVCVQNEDKSSVSVPDEDVTISRISLKRESVEKTRERKGADDDNHCEEVILPEETHRGTKKRSVDENEMYESNKKKDSCNVASKQRSNRRRRPFRDRLNGARFSSKSSHGTSSRNYDRGQANSGDASFCDFDHNQSNCSNDNQYSWFNDDQSNCSNDVQQGYDPNRDYSNISFVNVDNFNGNYNVNSFEPSANVNFTGVEDCSDYRRDRRDDGYGYSDHCRR